MRRQELIKHLKKQGCVLYREGKRHTLYLNPNNGRVSPIPRHQGINNFLVIKDMFC
ncbi:MAG: type II toxin-antitoxin system HicA family toxin [Dehalococcoidia bacterium]|nr:type II toxin-antitoxin system HicA family toxin [Dehalococcoidia bacterium]